MTPGASGPRTRAFKVRIPRRLSLARSRRALAIRLALPARAAVTATLRTVKGKRVASRTKRYGAGAHTLTLRLPAAGAKAGMLRVELVAALPGGPAARVATLRVTK
jgi:hypothetical protein